MGNRAVVSVEGSKVGVYLHWNGGPEIMAINKPIFERKE